MPCPIENADASRLRTFFLEAGYDQNKFWTPGLKDAIMRRGGGEPYMIERTAEPTHLNLLLRLFLLGMSAPRENTDAFIPGSVLEDMLACGIVTDRGHSIAARIMLSRVGDWLIAADRADEQDRPDLIIWPNPTTRMLDLFTVRSHSRSTLDLGSGSGVQSVLASLHSDAVIATDLNPRAAEFTTFNAWLNSRDNIQTTTGDTFEPVRGSQFDLIIANPPFFIGPTSGRMYCESGMELDSYCRRLVSEAPSLLNEGGWFQMVFEWVEVSDSKWQDRLVEWLKGSGCDAWLLHGYVYERALYAEKRTEHDKYGGTDSDALARSISYLRERGVERVHGGFLALRRRAGTNWIRMDEATRPATEPFGPEIEETFQLQDALAECTQERIMSFRPSIPRDARLVQEFTNADRRWVPERVTMTRATAVPASATLDMQVADFVARCDGNRTVSELADELGQAVSASPEEVRNQCRTVIQYLAARRLIRL